MIIKYILPVIELSNNILNHQISYEVFLSMYEKLNKSKILYKKYLNYYSNNLILEYIKNYNTNNIIYNVYKTKIKNKTYIDNYVLIEKKIKKKLPLLFDMKNINYVEKKIELPDKTTFEINNKNKEINFLNLLP